MKKRMKGKWLIIIALAITTVLMLVLTACGTPDDGGDPEPGDDNPPAPAVQTLATPTELKIENAAFKWRQVTDAESYRVTVGADGYDVTARSFDLTPVIIAGGEVVLGVTAKASGYNDSAAANLTATVTKLATPAIVVAEGDFGERFEWAAVTGAIGYTVSLDNGATWKESQTGLTYTPQAVGTYRIVVKALGNINGTEFCIDGDASAQSAEIVIAAAKPVFSAVPATGLLTLTGGVEGATRYALFVNDAEKADITLNAAYDLYDSAITATGVYNLRVTAYNDGAVISTSVEQEFLSKVLNPGELFSFDNRETLPYDHKSDNVTITVQDTVKYGTSGYAAKLDITEREYAQIDVDLSGRHTFSNGNEYISYRAYFVKPNGYEGEVVSPLAPLSIKNASTSYSYTADGLPIAFGVWTQLYISIPQWNSMPTTMVLILFDGGLGNHTVYIDDLYVHNYVNEHGTSIPEYPSGSYTFFGITDNVTTRPSNSRAITLPNTVPLGEVFLNVKASVDTFNGTALINSPARRFGLSTDGENIAVFVNGKPHYIGSDAVTYTFELTVGASRTATLYYNDFGWNEYLNIEIVSFEQGQDLSVYDWVHRGVGSGANDLNYTLPAGVDVEVGSTYTFTVDFYVGTVMGGNLSGDGGGTGRRFRIANNLGGVALDWIYLTETIYPTYAELPAYGTPTRVTFIARVGTGKTLNMSIRYFNTNEFIAFDFVSVVPAG
jgi:hypothetical protein